MKILLLGVIVCAAFGGFLMVQGGSMTGEALRVRPPAVAGSFYPADAKELRKIVDDFLAQAATPVFHNVVALVAPHAGYPYSGPVAAWSYKMLIGRKVSRVVVIAPSHYEAFDFAAVYNGAAYATPLGQVSVDRRFAERLVKMSPRVKLSDAGHGPREHALEVQLPFLQRVLGEFQVVPIVMGDQSYDSSRALGLALAKLIQGTDTLIVASSDLSHYHPYAEAVRIDWKTLHAIEGWDYLNLSRNFGLGVWEACGGAPIVAAMIAAERLGGTKAQVLKYANSGDTSGDRSRVVGYSAIALLKEPSAVGAGEEALSLTRWEQDELLGIARKSVETAVTQHRIFEPSPAKPDALSEEHGAFVTITSRGRLRGCIGYISPIKPLYITVRDAAVQAALNDSRFPAIRPAELGELEYEVSVLSPLRHVRDIHEIRVGRDGLVVRNADHEGLLLPQVAVEEHWDRTTFVEQACRKAGLPEDAWLRPETDIFRFTALIFGHREKLEAVSPVEPLSKSPQAPTPRAPDLPWLTAARF
jgi:AmmeMemoRadiSam system protein B/AmmeMemoRadiSam system protein A